jgi:hypothetical protein
VLQQEFYSTAMLETAKGRTIRPESAYVTPRGTNLLVTLRFPNSPALTEADKEVRFRATAKPFTIDRRFRLKAMVAGGKLEL